MTLYINVHYIYYIIFNSYTYILYIYQILIPFYTFRYFFSDFQLAPWPVIGHPCSLDSPSIGTLSGLSTGEHRSGVVVGKGRSVDHCLVLLFVVLLGRLLDDLDFGLAIFGFRIGFEKFIQHHPAIGIPPAIGNPRGWIL